MNIIKSLILLLFCCHITLSNANTSVFEKGASFYPNNEKLSQDGAVSGFIEVPENWNKPQGKKIKLAVLVLKNTAQLDDDNPVLFLEGGPGAGGVEMAQYWTNHPIRKKRDFVFVDTRGTGFSQPTLCPDLGDKFMEMFAMDLEGKESEKHKLDLVLSCKKELLNKKIDLSAYNSRSIAKDLNALKQALGYKQWNIYSVSYGTHTAQVYAKTIPQDIRTLVLDSAIPDISTVFSSNTSNFMESLNKVFQYCADDEACSKDYPDLKQTFYNTLDKLEKSPITVEVDNKIIPEGTFTFNAEEFKIATHQALYQRRLIEVLPLLISRFNDENKESLTALIAAFKGALALDYGVYFSVICNEGIPLNSLTSYNADVSKFEKLGGPISFYKSDFAICDDWISTSTPIDSTSNTEADAMAFKIPTLIFSGEFDPMTPPTYGQVLKNRYQNSFLIEVAGYGHVPSYNLTGGNIIKEFVETPNVHPTTKYKTEKGSNFATDITTNGAVVNLASSLDKFDFLFFLPILIALFVFLITLVQKVYALIKGTSKTTFYDILIGLTSLIGITILPAYLLAISKTAGQNFYILAFGLPENFDFLSFLPLLFAALSLISLLIFFIKIKSIQKKGFVIATLFSCILFCTYLYNWGFY